MGAHEGTGFVQVPWNFLVGELCDLLEEHLESLREGIKCRRSTSGSATGTEGLHLPPVPLIDTPLDEESFEDEDDIPIELFTVATTSTVHLVSKSTTCGSVCLISLCQLRCT